MTFQRLPARTALGTLCLQPCPPLPLSHTLIGSVPFQVLTSTLPSKLSPSQDATGIRTSALLFAGSRRSNEPLATLRTSATCNHAASVDPTRANGRILDLLTKNASASHPVPNTRPQLHPRPRGSRTDPRVDQSQLTAEGLAIPEAVQVSNFTWTPVIGAHSYTIALRRAENGEQLGEFRQSSTRLAQALPPLAVGNYQLVVRAIDELELAGLESEPLRLQIVGVKAPAGAKFHADARVELPQSQTIQLNNADGLTLTRSSERVKRRASEPIGVSDGKPTPILIEGDKSDSPCLMWLLPGKTPVSAHVGPKWVIWPQESVNLEVRWTDALGQGMASDVEPVVNVFVGIEPVGVIWDKKPDAWRARLSPQPGHGPWVVRLEVHDQKGGLLARDFVEVEPRPKHHPLTAPASLADLSSMR